MIKQKIKQIQENKKINKIYDIVIWIVEFLVTLLLNYCLIKIICNKHYYLKGTELFLEGIVLFSIICLLIIIIINCIKYKKKVEKIFLTFVIPIGITFLVFLMPFYAPDEVAHIVKSYDVSQGNMTTNNEIEEGKYRVKVPRHLTQYSFANFRNYKDLVEAMKATTDYNDTVYISTDAQSNLGIIYLPSSIGFFIARLFNINIMLAIYMARLFNFIFFIILGYYAIKIIPFGKMVLYIYMFTPMYLQQSVSLSPDSMINIMILFFIAYVLKLAFEETDMRKRDIAILGIGSIFIAMAKYVYLPILGIMLFLIRNKNIPKKKLAITIIVCYIVAIIVGLISITISSKYTDERKYVQENYINSSEQIQYIKENPKEFVKTVKNTVLSESGKEWIYDFAGWRLGWQSIEMPQVLPLVVLFLIITSPFIEKHEEVLNKKEKTLLILIFLGISIAIIVGFYITWTVVGAGLIAGVQGRYFIPVAILFLLSLCLKNNYIKGANKIYYLAIVPINLIAIMNVVQYFISKGV